ncbi:hypothetical protein J437_LFUL014415 [Ladona fulva]|uniref:ABC transmembrane type-1 domain-containing protein n=1 Tax=Ladona fulva TaxID=123851 RepID=A0A8K0K6K7_LADFU|nr:hypothetical protein J437_LFUL014415 [Ladona fulva]
MEFSEEGRNDWTWKQLCGPSGFEVWESSMGDFGMCFEKIGLRFPVLALLAWISAYYCGNQRVWVARSHQQLLIITGRSIAIFLLACIPIVYIITSLAVEPESLALIDYVISGMECFTWLVHIVYVIALKSRLSISPRGPNSVIIIWMLNLIVACICLRSHSIRYYKQNFSHLLSLGVSVSSLTLHISYAISLLPSEQMGSSRYEELGQGMPGYVSERQPLLSPGVGSIFSRLSEERDPNYLGVAKEQSSIFSKLFFLWVNPLMRKGYEGNLISSDDLFDLPLNMSTAVMSYELNLALASQQADTTNVSVGTTEETNVSYEPLNKVSLVRAMHKCFGMQFYGIGVLKFVANCAGFFGPLLLNYLVTFIEEKNEPLRNGYLYAFGLLVVTLTAAFCNAHFNYFMAEVGLKIRAAIISTIYRKILLLKSTTLSQFSVGEIVNFMSTDTDRIVNSCPSFHAFWSIPFEVSKISLKL